MKYIIPILVIILCILGMANNVLPIVSGYVFVAAAIVILYQVVIKLLQ